MAPTATRTNSNKPRRGGTTATSLLLAAAYTLAAVLILQGLVSPTAAMKMDTANTMDDDADMVEDFAKMVMSESVFAMYVARHALPLPAKQAVNAVTHPLPRTHTPPTSSPFLGRANKTTYPFG
jgi:hypothetical protein